MFELEEPEPMPYIPDLQTIDDLLIESFKNYSDDENEPLQLLSMENSNSRNSNSDSGNSIPSNFDMFCSHELDGNFLSNNNNTIACNVAENYNRREVICNGQLEDPAGRSNNNNKNETNINFDQNPSGNFGNQQNLILSDYGTDKEEVFHSRGQTDVSSQREEHNTQNEMLQSHQIDQFYVNTSELPPSTQNPVFLAPNEIENLNQININNGFQNMHPLNNLFTGNYFGIANFNIQNNYSSNNDYFAQSQSQQNLDQPMTNKFSPPQKRKYSDQKPSAENSQPKKKKIGRPKKGEERGILQQISSDRTTIKKPAKKSYYIKKIKKAPKTQQEIKEERKELQHIPEIQPKNNKNLLVKDQLRNFANEVRKARVRLGFTQADVGISLGALFNKNFSQTTICRFESLQLSYKNLNALTPVLQQWLTVSMTDPNRVVHMTELAQDEINRRKNLELDEKAIDCLQAQWLRCGEKSPSFQVMANIAHSVGVDREVIKKWFQEKERQKSENEK